MDHGRCKTHEAHGLGCSDFERLRSRAGDACEICLTPDEDDPRWHCLHIDHDRHGVRGLLCSDCNTRLGRCEDDGPWHVKFVLDNRQRAYLAAPFWALPESLAAAQRKADAKARRDAAMEALRAGTVDFTPTSGVPVPDRYRPLVEAALDAGIRQSHIVRAGGFTQNWVSKVAFAHRIIRERDEA